MKLKDIAEALSLEVRSYQEGLNNEVTGAYVSDLLSDVMANAVDGNVWITLQTHMNIVAVASLKGIKGVIIVGNRQVQNDVMKKAGEEKVTILTTSLHAFDVAGKVYHLLK